MNLVSFDALRTLGINGVHYIKPEQMFGQLDRIREADGVLFPEYWQVNTLAFALKKPLFPSLPSYLIGHDKVEMTRCFRALTPAHVPATEIAANTAEQAERIWDLMNLPFVAKIPRSSMGEGVFLIGDRGQWRDYLALTPVIYAQEYLPIDRDLRIVWVGDRVVDGYWRMQSDRGFHNNIARGGRAREGIIPPTALELVERLASSLGIDHGGFDVAVVAGHPYVLEFNRIFGTRGLTGGQGTVDREIISWLTRNWGPEHPLEPVPGRLPESA